MADKLSYTKLGQGAASATFDSMLRKFGIVTVMNAEVYDFEAVKAAVESDNTAFAKHKVNEIIDAITGTDSTIKPLCTLNTLKIANVTVEGPTKTVTGGQYTNPLIKYGKTARLEMQDALGNVDAIEAFGGGFVEHFEASSESGENHALGTNPVERGYADVLHIGSTFCGARTIIGDTFFIDQVTGSQVRVKIIFYQVMPDSIFNLTQDAEGDATVFDLNGDLLMTDITVGTLGNSTSHGTQEVGVFYSIYSGAQEGIVGKDTPVVD